MATNFQGQNRQNRLIQLHIWNFRPQFAYHYTTFMTINSCLQVNEVPYVG